MSDAKDLRWEREEEAARLGRLQTVPERRSDRGWAGSVLAGVLLLVCGMASMLYVLRKAGSETVLGEVASRLLRSGTATVSAPMVVSQIQRLNRLETVSYSVDTVVEGKRTNAVLPDLLFGDRILLVVHGQVTAGVDLSKLKPESVAVNNRSVTLDLPPSQLFATRIDEGKSRVFARTTGVLVPTDPNLETDTRRTAETQIEQAAMGDGILDTARANARASMESLLRGLGFESVTVR